MQSDKMKIVYIPVEDLLPDEDNPNVQKDAVFNALVENIQEIGMVEPIMVAPAYDENENRIEGKYRIVSGHHRYEACKLLDYTEVPCIIQEDFDKDMQKFQLVRMNMLRGKIDPVKFTKLFNEMAEKYGEELVKQAMALVDEQAFKKLYIDVKKELPKELQEKLEEAKDDIKTVDDLSRILNSLFTKYGDTLQYNFMVFTFGGKTHYWIIMDKEVKAQMDKLADMCKEKEVDINLAFKKMFVGTDMNDVVEEIVEEGFANTEIDF